MVHADAGAKREGERWKHGWINKDDNEGKKQKKTFAPRLRVAASV